MPCARSNVSSMSASASLRPSLFSSSFHCAHVHWGLVEQSPRRSREHIGVNVQWAHAALQHQMQSDGSVSDSPPGAHSALFTACVAAAAHASQWTCPPPGRNNRAVSIAGSMRSVNPAIPARFPLGRGCLRVIWCISRPANTCGAESGCREPSSAARLLVHAPGASAGIVERPPASAVQARRPEVSCLNTSRQSMANPIPGLFHTRSRVLPVLHLQPAILARELPAPPHAVLQSSSPSSPDKTLPTAARACIPMWAVYAAGRPGQQCPDLSTM